MAIESWGVVGNKVSKEDWNQIINGLKCHSMELEFILWVDFAISCGILITGRLLVSEACLHHLLATWFQAVSQRGFSQSRHWDGLGGARWLLEIKAMRGRGREEGRGRSQRQFNKVSASLIASSQARMACPSCPVSSWNGLDFIPSLTQSPDAQTGHDLAWYGSLQLSRTWRKKLSIDSWVASLSLKGLWAAQLCVSHGQFPSFCSSVPSPAKWK